MKRHVTVAVTLGLLISSLASQALFAGAKTAAFAVIPGQSLGAVRLGSTQAAVHRTLGLPRSHGIRRGLTVEYFSSASDTSHDINVVYRRGRVIQIETDAPEFLTRQGISPDSTLGQIRSKLGRLSVVSFGQGNPDPDYADHAAHYYDDVRHGLAFELDLGYRADTSADVVPAGIIVHLAGHRVLPVP